MSFFLKKEANYVQLATTSQSTMMLENKEPHTLTSRQSVNRLEI